MSETKMFTPSAESVAWVIDAVSDIALGVVERLTLSTAPNRDDWFLKMLTDLDWEVRGGTWEEPRWAFEEHPWFAALGLTRTECEDYLRGES